MTKNKIQDLRNHLFAQLERLQDDELDLVEEANRAKAMAQIAHQIIESAKVENEYIRVTDTSDKSKFILLEEN
jgi:hypothetical protein